MGVISDILMIDSEMVHAVDRVSCMFGLERALASVCSSLMGHVGGWLAILVATLSYGSLFVPVKNYDIHDGLVYQWFQCCGILLAGMIQASVRNDWDAAGLSAPGFYVCKEGMLSGVFFQVANVLATQSVKTFGMSNYFTTQKVTNLGGAFVVGVFGNRVGLPVQTPSNPILALMGCLSVVLAMIPLAFTEEEVDRLDLLERTPGQDKRPHLIPPQHSEMGGYIMLDDASSSAPATPNPTPLMQRRHYTNPGDWCKGLTWSLLAGFAFSFIYIPLLPWKQRMLKADVKDYSSFDYFLSISIGLFMASTCYMLLGGAMRKYQGRKLMKSVLRPALMNGVMWSVASMAQLYAISAMPYAVAYCLVCGGEVAVSLLWGIFVFKEATTRHNLRCTLLAFLGVLAGVALVAASK